MRGQAVRPGGGEGHERGWKQLSRLGARRRRLLKKESSRDLDPKVLVAARALLDRRRVLGVVVRLPRARRPLAAAAALAAAALAATAALAAAALAAAAGGLRRPRRLAVVGLGRLGLGLGFGDPRSRLVDGREVNLRTRAIMSAVEEGCGKRAAERTITESFE